MLLIEVLNIVYKKLYLVVIIFFISFLLLTNYKIIDDEYLLKRYVVIGKHDGTTNFPSMEVFVNAYNSPQFRNNVDIEKVWYELSIESGGLLLTMKGSNPDLMIKGSESWLSEINQIENDLYLEITNQKHQNSIDKIKAKIDYFENFDSKFGSDEVLSDVYLFSILDANIEADSFQRLNDATFELKSKNIESLFIPTKFYLNKTSSPIKYFPNPLIYIAISFLVSLVFILAILGLDFRKRANGD